MNDAECRRINGSEEIVPSETRAIAEADENSVFVSNLGVQTDFEAIVLDVSVTRRPGGCATLRGGILNVEPRVATRERKQHCRTVARRT